MIEDYEKEIQNKLNIFFDFFYDPKENMGELSRLYNLEYKDKMAKKGFVFGKNGYVRSPLEYAFALILEKLELRFFTQYNVGDRSFDFYLLDLKVLIELDGKNYHLISADDVHGKKIFYKLHGECKKCGEFNRLDQEVEKEIIRDYEKSREPAKHGVRFIKFFSEELWTHKYKKKPKLNEGVLCTIAQEIIDLVNSPADGWIKSRLLRFMKSQGGN